MKGKINFNRNRNHNRSKFTTITHLCSIERYFLKANTSDKRKADFAIDYLTGTRQFKEKT